MAEQMRFAPGGVVRRTLVHGNFTPGSDHVLRLSDVLLDKFDRAAHVAEIRLTAGFTLATEDGAMTEAGGARESHLVWRNIGLRLAGREHFDGGVDGLDLARYFSHLTGASDPFAGGGAAAPAVSIPDADGTPSIYASMCIPFLGAEGSAFRTERLVPAKLLLDQDACLRVSIAPSLAAGVTVTACTSMVLSITLVYLDEINVYTPFRVRTASTTELEFVVRPVGALEFLTVCSRDGATTAAMRSHANYVLESLHVGGENVLVQPNPTRDQYVYQRLVFEGGTLGGEALARALDAQCFDLFTTPAFDRRATKMVRGDIAVKFASVPSAFTRHRYLWCETGIGTAEHRQAIRTSLGLRGGARYRTKAPREHALTGLIATSMNPSDYPAVRVRAKANKA